MIFLTGMMTKPEILCEQEQAKSGQNGLKISYFRKFLIKLACWGVLIFLLLSYRIPASHTTPFMFEEYVKETRRPCRQVSHRWNVSFIICGALRLETAPNPSAVNSEKSLGPYRIDMQTVQLQICDQVFKQKKKKGKKKTMATFLIPFPLALTMTPPAKGPCERLAPVRV